MSKAFNVSQADTVTNIEELLSSSKTKAVNVLNYHSDTEGGGGVFYWDATGNKAEHNGGTVIDPDATFPSDWSNTAQQATWFTAGTGTGVWRRQYDGAVSKEMFGTLGDTPYGEANIKVLIGDKLDGHYGWGSIVEADNGDLVFIYRKGTEHGTEDGTELRKAISHNKGDSWVDDVILYTDPLHDARPDKIAKLANGRLGFFLNRADEGSTHFSPLFFYSDDNGQTFTSNVVSTSSPYTFSAVGGIIDFPSSQGGNDATGFISFGYLSAGGIDAFTTVDNGNTWSIVNEVATASNTITYISENVQVRVGNQDKWLMFSRASDVSGTHIPLTVFATTNLLDWGVPQDAGVELNGNPPSAYYDEVTNKIHFVVSSRSGKEVDGNGNALLYVSEDADILFNNGGVFSNNLSRLASLPHWATGYVYPFKLGGKWSAVFTAGEPQSNVSGSYSAMFMIGDFKPKQADITRFIELFTKRLENVKSLDLVAETNELSEYPIRIRNRGKSASLFVSAYGEKREGGGSACSNIYNNGDINYSYQNTAIFESDEHLIFKSFNTLFGNLTDNINGSSSCVHLPVSASTIPALRSQAIGTGSLRKHYILHHTSATTNPPEVGSISTTVTATSFNTSSDETLKDFKGEYNGLDAIEIIKQDPVRKFTWKVNGESAIGWGAQTSYTISKDLATKGGWYLNDEEVEEGTNGAVYIPWSIDQSKRTPYLWSALALLIARVEELEGKVNTN